MMRGDAELTEAVKEVRSAAWTSAAGDIEGRSALSDGRIQSRGSDGSRSLRLPDGRQEWLDQQGGEQRSRKLGVVPVTSM